MEFSAFYEAVVEILKLGIKDIVKHLLHAKEIVGARIEATPARYIFTLLRCTKPRAGLKSSSITR